MPRYANSIIALCLLMLLWIHPVHAHQGAGGKPVLHVAGWDVYSDPERPDKTIGYQSFEALFGATIEFTPLTNLDAIIEAAESDRHYDVFIISNEGAKILYDMKLVQPLVLSNLPNYDNLHPSLKYSAWCQFDARIYAVPWAWGPTGLLYDADGEIVGAIESLRDITDSKRMEEELAALDEELRVLHRQVPSLCAAWQCVLR